MVMLGMGGRQDGHAEREGRNQRRKSFSFHFFYLDHCFGLGAKKSYVPPIHSTHEADQAFRKRHRKAHAISIRNNNCAKLDLVHTKCMQAEPMLGSAHDVEY
jgi:hypothetical protein